MTDVLFARAQMGTTLAFHIVFAAIGVAMPLMMLIAEWRWHRTHDAEYLALARTWATGTAIFFAVGAVSGTVLSFELGLLFPGFMQFAGPVVGVPFSLEAIAFFTEAVCLGLYLYGWDRLSARAHLLAGAGVAVSGLASAVFVTLVNAWMNTPRGFLTDATGKIIAIDHAVALTTPAGLHETVHMALAAYLSTGLVVAALHAAMLRRRSSTFHHKALAISLAVVVPCALLQPLVGHFAGQRVAELQPVKLAAMEGIEKTTAHAPLTIGPIEIPDLVSILAYDDPDAVVLGLDQVPVQDRPPSVTAIAFDAMVALGMAIGAYGLWVAIVYMRRKRLPASRRFLLATVLLGPAGMLAMEAGWCVTELGRQPWVVYNIQRTAAAATPAPGLAVPFAVFAAVYALLAVVVVLALRRHVRAAEEPAP
jgi:cytochrome d ubiquinol oxidase subunit I